MDAQLRETFEETCVTAVEDLPEENESVSTNLLRIAELPKHVEAEKCDY